MRFQVTVRYGDRAQRYHTFGVDCATAREALAEASRVMPDEVATSADLVEVRRAVDPDRRHYTEP